MKSIHKTVYTFPTKYESGFTNKEIKTLLKGFPGASVKKFNETLFGSTIKVIAGEMVIYHHDVEKALLCSTGKRSLNENEFD